MEDDGGDASRAFFDNALRSEFYLALTGAVGFLDGGLADDGGTRREVRSLDDLDEGLHVRVGIVDELDGAVDDLAEVMGRNGGGHTDCDAVGAVDQQIGESGGQHHGFFFFAVVVVDEVYGVLVDVPEHLQGKGSHAGFGVTGSRRAVAVHGTEVAVAVHEAVAHVPGLGQAYHGVVDGCIAVGVVFTHDFAHDTGGLFMGFVRRDAQGIQAVQNAAVDRLKAVPHVGKRSCNDYAHGVIDVGGLHFFVYLVL